MQLVDTPRNHSLFVIVKYKRNVCHKRNHSVYHKHKRNVFRKRSLSVCHNHTENVNLKQHLLVSNIQMWIEVVRM